LSAETAELEIGSQLLRQQVKPCKPGAGGSWIPIEQTRTVGRAKTAAITTFINIMPQRLSLLEQRPAELPEANCGLCHL
jgi:hypothetical protein